jgi:hypothetical protein
MAYTAERPPQRRSSDELRATIPGWGVDLDPADRPAFPQEQALETGAHWDFPDRQPGWEGRERSIEHAFVTPVFGTSVPLKGLSGAVRRLAYARFSEARAAHWLLLLAGDRIDAGESHLRSFATLRPDNPITQTGLRSEISHHGVSSRVGQGRADLKHQWLDPVVVGAPWVVGGALVLRLVRRLRSAGSPSV